METLDAVTLRPLVRAWLREDVGRGDRTTLALVPADQTGAARIEAREEAVIAGLFVARQCFELLAPGEVRFSSLVAEGARVRPSAELARIEGPLRAILTGERTALNIMARVSGVATAAAGYVAAVAGTPARIVDTRKTTPGLRVLEKYGVVAGGGANHRFGLDDGVLIKDNHIAACGSVGEAVGRARRGVVHGLRIEVEVSSLDQLDEALAAGADAVLLDNMRVASVADAVTRAGGKVLLEVSGGITIDNVRSYAETGVDLISVGALTHSARSVDVSLEVTG